MYDQQKQLTMNIETISQFFISFNYIFLVIVPEVTLTDESLIFNDDSQHFFFKYLFINKK